jgi:hypothetical protein
MLRQAGPASCSAATERLAEVAQHIGQAAAHTGSGDPASEDKQAVYYAQSVFKDQLKKFKNACVRGAVGSKSATVAFNGLAGMRRRRKK